MFSWSISRTDEIRGVKNFFAHQSGVKETVDLLPVVTGRFVSINGQTIDQLKDQHFPRRMLQMAPLSWADAPPPGDKIKQGKWWTDPNANEIAIGQGTAERIHVGIGSQIELEVGGTVHKVRVAALYQPDGQHIGMQVSFILPSALLKGQPATWYGGVHIDPKQVGAMERALFLAYPSITVINLADILSGSSRLWIRSRSWCGSWRVLHLCRAHDPGFERCQHALPTHARGGGAEDAGSDADENCPHVQRGVLSARAAGGSVGVVFANLLTRILIHLAEVEFHVNWPATLTALFGTAVLATATGWIASYRILGLRPLEVLREE
jgi:putative ABC transport system permease protein